MFSCLKDHLGCAVECLRCGFDGEFSWKSDEDACIRQSVNDNECISRACSRERAQFVELSFCDDGSLPQCGEDFFCRLYEFIRCLFPGAMAVMPSPTEAGVFGMTRTISASGSPFSRVSKATAAAMEMTFFG